MNEKNNLKGSLILCLTALIWGLAFVAQSSAAATLPPFIVIATRSYIAVVILFILYKIVNRGMSKRMIPKDRKERRSVLLGGLACGTLLAVSSNLQQAALSVFPKGVSSEARAGFLTALYVVIVPVISVFFHKKIHLIIWGAIAVAMTGVYLLCFNGGFSGIYLGDILLLLCAVCFSFHIIVVDKFCNPLGGIRLSCLQFVFCGTISLVLSLIFERGQYNIGSIVSCAPQILYLGVMSSGVAYTLQIVGQRFAEPAVASISMSLESVFAALGGWVISGNRLSLREIIGCALVFAAIILAQTPEFKLHKSEA